MTITEDEALAFAEHHVEVWNTHVMDDILDLYTEDVRLTSPLAGNVTGSNVVVGREGLRKYFSAALERYPDLQFKIVDVLRCVDTVTIYFRSVNDRLVAEVLFLDEDKRIRQVLAHYSVTGDS